MYGLPCQEKSVQTEDGSQLDPKHAVERSNVRIYVNNNNKH
jgi:hypothetical protein